MYVLVADVTNILKVLFDTIYKIYLFLNSIEFTAFGFNFTLLGLSLGLIFLTILIKFMKFGFEVGVGAEIKSSRSENKSNYLPKHAEGRNSDVGDKTRFKSRWI